MVEGVGIDIIEVERVEARIASGNGFREFVFTAYEIEYCESMTQKYQHYAARFSAKEAFMKALGTGWTGEVRFNEIEVRQEAGARPQIQLYGETLKIFTEKNLGNVSVSLSHLKQMATAIVIIEKDEQPA